MEDTEVIVPWAPRQPCQVIRRRVHRPRGLRRHQRVPIALLPPFRTSRIKRFFKESRSRPRARWGRWADRPASSRKWTGARRHRTRRALPASAVRFWGEYPVYSLLWLLPHVSKSHATFARLSWHTKRTQWFIYWDWCRDHADKLKDPSAHFLLFNNIYISRVNNVKSF